MSQPQSPIQQPQFPRPEFPRPEFPRPEFPQPPFPGQQHLQQAVPYVPQSSARFTKHTGLVIMGLTQKVDVYGAYDDIRSAFWKAQLHCLLLGWWGVISLIAYNPAAMYGNWLTMRAVKRALLTAG